MSAVAKRAGVERRTLYRHFPNEADLFAACSAHYFSANPWPDVKPWRAIRDPHGLVFSTWHSLTTNGIRRADAVKLTTALVDAVTQA